MQQTKKKYIKYLAYFGIPFFVAYLTAVQAEDIVSYVFTSQVATAS